MATPSKYTMDTNSYFPNEGDFKWHHAITLILERWDETNKILLALAAVLSSPHDVAYQDGYERGLEDGKKAEGRIGQP